MNILNVNYAGQNKTSPWRRISLGSWRPVGDSSVFVEQEIRVEPLLKLIRRYRQETGAVLTLNHIYGRILGLALSKHPEFNVVVRGGRIFHRAHVDIFFHVTRTGADDLCGLKITRAETKTLSEIASEFENKLVLVRGGKDPVFRGTKNSFRFIPGFLSRLVLDSIGFLAYTLNLNLSFLGVPQDPFGSLMVSNVGALGIEGGFTVIAPYSRIPMVVALCAIRNQPVVEDDGQVRAGQVMKVAFTFDHRVVDGAHIGRFLKTFRLLCKHPELCLEKGVRNHGQRENPDRKISADGDSIRSTPSFR